MDGSYRGVCKGSPAADGSMYASCVLHHEHVILPRNQNHWRLTWCAWWWLGHVSHHHRCCFTFLWMHTPHLQQGWRYRTTSLLVQRLCCSHTPAFHLLHLLAAVSSMLFRWLVAVVAPFSDAHFSDAHTIVVGCCRSPILSCAHACMLTGRLDLPCLG